MASLHRKLFPLAWFVKKTRRRHRMGAVLSSLLWAFVLCERKTSSLHSFSQKMKSKHHNTLFLNSFFMDYTSCIKMTKPAYICPTSELARSIGRGDNTSPRHFPCKLCAIFMEANLCLPIARSWVKRKII